MIGFILGPICAWLGVSLPVLILLIILLVLIIKS